MKFGHVQTHVSGAATAASNLMMMMMTLARGKKEKEKITNHDPKLSTLFSDFALNFLNSVSRSSGSSDAILFCCNFSLRSGKTASDYS
jgi:hypothetical protein